jgi:hypothetical protein
MNVLEQYESKVPSQAIEEHVHASCEQFDSFVHVSPPWVWVTGIRGSGRPSPESPTPRGVALTSQTGPRALRRRTPGIP